MSRTPGVRGIRVRARSILRPAAFLAATLLPISAVAAAAPPSKSHRKPPAQTPPTQATSVAPDSQPAEPRLYLSWNAPYGAPRASAAIPAPCGDTTATDTLYLTFDPGKDAPGFVGATAVLYFEAAPGAELPDRWKRATQAAPPVRVIFTADPDRGFPTPWSAQGAGAPFYDFFAGRGRLRLIYAIAENSGPGVKAGKRYGIARVLVPRSPAGADGCAAPLCVEWSEGELAYSRRESRKAGQGERWVTMNSPDGTPCMRARSSFGATPWKPGTSH